MIHEIRRVRVEEYAYCVNKLRRNVGLETLIWRPIVCHKQRTWYSNDHHLPLNEPPTMQIFCVRHCFYVTGISPRNPKKAAKLKPTDFHVNFLLYLPFGLPDSTIWWSFIWITQRCTFWFSLMSWKLNNKTFFTEFCSFGTNSPIVAKFRIAFPLEEGFDKVALCVKVDPSHCCCVFYFSW